MLAEHLLEGKVCLGVKITFSHNSTLFSLAKLGKRIENGKDFIVFLSEKHKNHILLHLF